MLEPDTLLQERYLIQSLIGQGCMGAVYKAVDQRSNNLVALKHKYHADNHTDKTFEREASVLFGLQHSALPRVTDYFFDETGQFLVMEFVPGDDLSVPLLREHRPFPLDKVMVWADQILDVLDYLHGQDPPFIHRDIKPQNLKLTSKEHIVLLDFGLAKGDISLDELEGSTLPYFTPDYAPLEQIQGKGADSRSDLYALAATLHHLLTASIPADALSRAADLACSRPDPQRPAHALNRVIPSRVSAVLMHALAMKMDERPSNAADMRAELRAACEGNSQEHKPTPSQARAMVAKDIVSLPNPRVVPSPDPFPEFMEQELPEQTKQPLLSSQPGWLWPLLAGVLVVLGLIAFFAMTGQKTTPSDMPKTPVGSSAPEMMGQEWHESDGAAFSSGGVLIASGANDGTIGLWEQDHDTSVPMQKWHDASNVAFMSNVSIQCERTICGQDGRAPRRTVFE
jgi:eukaryotic-like serine/threonine-protein kinase